MAKSAVVVVPTTGAAELQRCLESVLWQTYPATHLYVVCDGPLFLPAVHEILAGFDSPAIRLMALPDNVGAGGFYGHRIFAATSHLVSEDYLLFLDQDNWFDPDHVASLVHTIEARDLAWAYSLRKICAKDGTFLFNDNCESLGKWPAWTGINHVDTNSYCLKREVAVGVSSVWHGSWGQDRIFYKALDRHFPKYDCSGKYSVNYRLGGNPGAVTPDFFERGNASMTPNQDGSYPWQR